MKTRGLVLSLLVLFVVLVFTGNRIAEHILNRQQPPLLTEQLGLPVSLAPLDADLLTLTASTARLVMGDPSAPALDAKEVEVSLNWSDLIRGEVRLITAQGQNLTVQLSRWPSSDSPWPADYFFLDPWLPKQLSLAEGRYVAEDGETWPIREGKWQRSAEGAELSWTEDRTMGPVVVTTGMRSLPDLLGLARLDLEVELEIPETPSIALAQRESGWHWREGQVRLSGTGRTWGELLDSLQGYLSLSGFHQGRVDTPLSIDAKLGNSDDALVLESLDVRAGSAKLTGSLTFSGGKQRTLALKLDAEDLDLNFLFDDPHATPAPGIAIPEYLGFFPGIEVSWDVTARDLRLPNIHLAKAKISITRGVERGRVIVDATGEKDGELNLKLNWEPTDDKSSYVNMSLDLKDVDLARCFDQRLGLLESKTSGSVILNSQGSGIAEMFRVMQGDADLSMTLKSRPDGVDQAGLDEELRLTGGASLVMSPERILGIKIDHLNIDAIEQDLTGELTMAAGQSPWFAANLSSERFSISRIRGWIPETAEQADRVNLLQSLRQIGDAKLSLDFKELEVSGFTLYEVRSKIISGDDSFEFSQFDFTLEEGRFTSKAAINWQQEQATLTATGSVDNLVLDHFLGPKNTLHSVPLVGSYSLDGEGDSFARMLTTLDGDVQLQAISATTPDHRRELKVDLKRLPNGIDVRVDTLAWGLSELQGRLVYQAAEPPLWDVEVSGGDLSLLPWEAALDNEEQETPEEETSALGQAASTSAGVVRTLLTAPAKLLTGSTDSTLSGERFFSAEPIDLDFIRENNASFRVKLDSVSSLEGDVKDMSLDMELKDGKLSINAKASELNGGPAGFELSLDTTDELPAGELTATFKDVFRLPGRENYPRSGTIKFDSRGNSQAELAANLNGQAYIEFGRGPMDYGGLTFLTADVGAAMFRALIPGTEMRTAEMRCAVTVGEFENGVGITPYGYAARTRSANLLGRLEVDFRKEHLRIQFDSRSRGGTGLALGNVFSNTVRIEGPMVNPALVPSATGLLWRGWAAFMTAGLSVVGESMVKRVLAADAPCGDLRKEIQKNICGTDQRLATAPMVCPGAASVSDNKPAAS